MLCRVDLPGLDCDTVFMTGFGDFSLKVGEARLVLWRRCCLVVNAVVWATALAGCISVNTPDKPIVIELNINIKQEVIYRLAADAGKTIDTNKDIF